MNIDFPSGIVSSFTMENIPFSSLFEKERSICKSYESQRLSDFLRGRYCAHRCLASFQISSPVLKDDVGAPIWPEGFSGSISHTHGLAGAILSRKNTFLSVGLDIEKIGRIDTEIWPLLFTESEISLLHKLNSEKQQEVSTLMFSMKEAYYKMQYQLTKSGMEYDDLEVNPGESKIHFNIRNQKLKRLNQEKLIVNHVIQSSHIISIVLFKE